MLSFFGASFRGLCEGWRGKGKDFFVKHKAWRDYLNEHMWKAKGALVSLFA